MDTLTRQPEPRFDRPAPPAEEAAEPVVEAPACASCGAPLVDRQDWCLECGEPVEGRLGAQPGLRAAATVVIITLLLAGGAVAAAYAALSSDSSHQASKPPVAGSDAMPVPGAAPATPPPTPPAAATPPATPPPTPPAATTPKPATPAPAAATPAPVTPTVRQPSTTKTTPKKTTPVAPTAISLPDDAAALYDPYAKATDKGDAAKAIDGDPNTSFAVTARESASLDLGLTLDLGKQRGVKVVELQSKTPGYRVELYATDSAELPTDVLDTRWAHIKNRSDVGRTERIVLGGGSTKYRHVLLWFTKPPSSGTTVRIAEARLLG